jgi:hypothetical protein
MLNYYIVLLSSDFDNVISIMNYLFYFVWWWEFLNCYLILLVLKNIMFWKIMKRCEIFI